MLRQPWNPEVDTAVMAGLFILNVRDYCLGTILGHHTVRQNRVIGDIQTLEDP